MAIDAGEREVTVAPETLQSWPAFPAGIHLKLVTAEPAPGSSHADLVEPFVTLGNRGRFSRTLLGCVVGPGSGTIREVALKMQSDEYPVTDLEGWSNCDIDKQWCEQSRLWLSAAKDNSAAAVVDVLPKGEDGTAPLLPPTIYCKERRAFFVAPCPECGAPLETCRDGVLLEEYGLPRYDRSLERFLYCRACREARRAPQFYTLLLTEPALRTRAPVAEQIDLFGAFGELARKGGPLPCAGCRKMETCYPDNREAVGEVSRLLTPLSFYDYRCLPLERLHLHYDEFARLLGGGQVREPARAILPFETTAASTRRYLFQDDPLGKLPLEIFRLKLTLFDQLALAVSNFHRTMGLPHLALGPENVMVGLSAAATGLPAFYNFSTRLLGIGGTRPHQFGGLNTTSLIIPVLEPPPIRDAAYSAPQIGTSKAMHAGLLTINNVTPEGERVILDGNLVSDAFDVRTLRTKDAVHVMVRQGRPVPISVEFLANPTQHGQGTAYVAWRSTPVRVAESMARQVRSLIGQGPIRATFTVHQCLHVPCDLHSLGVVLFTTLLVNQEQGPAPVAAAARALGNRVAHFAREHPSANAEEIGAFALNILRDEEADDWIAPRNLYDRPSDQKDSRMSVLGSAWHAALVLGLRSLTQIPGFSFCRGHDDFDPAHAEGPVDHLRAELSILEYGIDAELLAMHGRRREIVNAIARVRARVLDDNSERVRTGITG